MKIFDKFYREYLEPLGEGLAEFAEYMMNTFIAMILYIGNVLLCIGLFVTSPLWLLPYLITKKKRERSDDTDEERW